MRMFIFFACCFASMARAALTQVTWGTLPESPIYVGQPYELTLTFETDANEEIQRYQADQGPKTQPTRQTTTKVNGRRRTTLYWQQVEERAKICAIPEGRVAANVAVTMRNILGGWNLSARTQQSVLPAFSYEVQELPGDAKGAPIGDFTLALTADRTTVAPGEVCQLTATLSAQSGLVPETLPFALTEDAEGVCYPFRVVAVEPHKLTAQAYFVVSAEKDTQVRLKPLKTFQLNTRTLVTVNAAPLTLRVRETSDATTKDVPITLGQGEAKGLPLRYAPIDRAPVIGVWVKPFTRHETYHDWTRVSCAEGEGWIRSSYLGEETL